MKTKRTFVVVCIAAAILGTGCTPDSTKPASTSSAASASTTATAPADSTSGPSSPGEEARAAFDNFLEMQNASGQDYFREFDTKVLPLTTGDLYENFWSVGQRYGGGDYHQAGPDKVEFQRFLDIEDGYVVMQVCVDSSSSQLIGPDGAPVSDTSRQHPVTSNVTMTRVVPPEADVDPQGQNWWRVSKYVVQTGTSCSL